jgi:GxxExxY protein
MDENQIGTIVIDSAIEVHRELGPGLLESIYEAALAYELTERGLRVDRQLPLPVRYKGLEFDEGFRADIVVENLVILELKSVEKINNAFRKQIQTYLKLSDKKLGYLLNFGEALMKDGIVRAVNHLV